MKLSILLVGSILTSAIAGNAYAQTCGAQPSCADLGYTRTSTDGCLGTALKCPFDKTKYNCVTTGDVFYQFKLNWSAAGGISGKTNWTAYQNGIIIGQGQDIGNYGSFITINGRKIGSLTGIAKQRTFFYANVSKGDTLYIDANDVSAVFIPYYGN